MNDLKDIRIMLKKQIEVVSNTSTTDENFKEQMEKSKTLSGTAFSYIKSLDTSLKIEEFAIKNGLSDEEMNKKLGL